MRKRSPLAHAVFGVVAVLTLTISSSRIVRTQGATINVTTTVQGVADDGLCSLQEAIYAANLDEGVAPNGSGGTFTTGCAAGSGDDVIVLAAGAVYNMTAPVDDPYNPLGPTATPIVLTNITIEGNGAQLTRPNPFLDFTGVPNFRAFAVSFATTACKDLPSDFAFVQRDLVVCGVDPFGQGGLGTTQGNLTIRNAYIKGFTAKGGNGAVGGGGGLGAGGAIYVAGGVLTIENSTFQHNGAGGGNGSVNPGRAGGGGGGLGGNGGVGNLGGGGGGGGSRGDGGTGSDTCGEPCLGIGAGGGGGGGTVARGADGSTDEPEAALRCGGQGGYVTLNPLNSPHNGRPGTCPGGGGGGGRDSLFGFAEVSGGNGGVGAYGGGGGGGAHRMTLGDGASGGFGGGGGGADGVDPNFPSGIGPSGGDGGFGGGGGAGHGGFLPVVGGGPGRGGSFAGSADAQHGGGGAALGGAIFGDKATIRIYNSTFYANYAVRGLSAGGNANSGRSVGAAIFAVDGSLEVLNSTLYKNETTSNGGGLVMYRSTRDGSSASLTLLNTIIAQNMAAVGRGECYILNAVNIVQAAGNLITNNTIDNLKETFDGSPYGDPRACPGHALSDDPQLQPLRLNAPGLTPTLAILLTSPAADVADPATSLATDQRGVGRPNNDGFDIGAYEARLPFFEVDGAFSDLFLGLGESMEIPFTVTSTDGFMAPVSLTFTTSGPGGLEVNVVPNSVTPRPDQPATATLSMLAGAFAVAGVHQIDLKAAAPDNSGRRLIIMVTVGVTPGGMAKAIDQMQLQGDIANLGVATSLTTKLSVSQKLIDRGELQAGINTLAALGYQVRALRANQVTAAAADSLLANLAVLMDSVAPQLKPNPLIGTVTDAAGQPVADATIAIISGKTTVATATTDATGFYYVARTDWPAGTSYSVKVTLPKGYKRSTPSQLTFTWSGSQVELSSFVLSK